MKSHQKGRIRGAGRAAVAVSLLGVVALLGMLPIVEAQGRRAYTIPSGALLRVRVETDIRSTTVRVGDPFRAIVVDPFYATGDVVVPEGSTLEGRVDEVRPARRWGQPSGVVVGFGTLTSVTGVSVDVAGHLADPGGVRMETVENLTRGTELTFRLSRAVPVDASFVESSDMLGEVVGAEATRRAGDALLITIQVRNVSRVRYTAEPVRRGETLVVTVTGVRDPRVVDRRATQEVVVEVPAREWRGVTRIVVRGSGRDVVINERDFSGGALTPQEAAALERRLESLLASYARALGVRYTPVTGQLAFTRANYGENEIELLFALNAVTSSSRLYTQLVRTTSDPQAISGAGDMIASQARIVERALGRTRSRNAQVVSRDWPAIGAELDRLAVQSADSAGRP